MLGLAIILNITAFPNENPACDFQSTWFNRVFLYYVLVPEVLIRFVFLGFWRTSRYLIQRKTILYVTAPCLYTAWFLLTMAHYREFTPNCYEPYPSYGLFVFCISMVLITPAAFLVICIASFLILFCPCISYSLGKAYYDQRQAAQLKTKVVNSLSKISFGRFKVEGQEECAICLGSFEDD